MSRRTRLWVAAAVAGAAAALLIRIRPDDPPAPRPGGIATPGPLTLDPARAESTPDWWICRQLYPSALTYDADGRIVCAEASTLEIAYDIELATDLDVEAFLDVFIRMALGRPDGRLEPLLVREEGRTLLWKRPDPMPGGLRLAATGPAPRAIEALAELLTPKVVDVSRSRRVTRIRMTFSDAATAARYAATGSVLEATVEGGVWRALQRWTRPIAGPASGTHFVLTGSYDEALELYRRGEVDGALVSGEGTPTGRVDVEVIAFNVGRLPEAVRRTIRDRKPLRSGAEIEILACVDDASAMTQADALAGALGTFARVRAAGRDEFDAAVRGGRFDLFVGAIPTGAGTDLGVWFKRLGWGCADAILADLEDTLERAPLEQQVWDRAQADAAVVVLARRPVSFVGKP